MDQITHFGSFLAASLLLNITPGSDTAFILARSLGQGRRSGVASALGISVGVCIHLLLAAFGLSAVLEKLPAAFAAIQLVGAAYLIYLGVVALYKVAKGAPLEWEATATKTLRPFREGLITNLLNPKVAVFFMAFLPQFVRPGAASSPVPFLVLGLVFLIPGTLWCLCLVFLADRFRTWILGCARMQRLLQAAMGATFFGLGLRLALASRSEP